MTQIINEIKLDFKDVVIKPKRSVIASRSNVELNRTFEFYHSPRQWTGFPIFASNMYCTGSMEMAKELLKFGACTALHKFYSVKELVDFYVFGFACYASHYVWMTIGGKPEDFQKLKAVKEGVPVCPNVVVDVANGHVETFVKRCALVREEFPEIVIMAGNVSTPEMVEELIIHGGVDIVKIFIAPGSQCETRKMTGIYSPTLSTILECADSAHGLRSGPKKNGLVCADGGIKESQDLCKAFGAGADFAMLGGYLAGARECIGNRDSDGKLEFYGMSSALAQRIHGNGVPDYATSEGKVSWIPDKGPVENLVKEIQGGLRSCCSYINCGSLKDMAKCTTFLRVNR